MKAVIQTIPARRELAEKQREAFGLPCEIHVDEKMSGPFKGFWDSLVAHPSGNEYRLHMQDDLIYANGIKDYIPEVERMMRENGLDLLSLYVPNIKQLREQYGKGKRFCQSFKGFTMLCTMFSPSLVAKMMEHAPSYLTSPHDDWFVSDTIYTYGLKAHVHLPSLVQHDITIKSSMGHANTERRTSPCFDKDFVTRWKRGEVK